MRKGVAELPELAAKYPTKEVLAGAEPDFFFAGWNYGMKVGGEVTPETLEPFGIKVYELTESCIHIGDKPKASLQDLYNDLLNLGKIFGVEDTAHDLVAAYKLELDRIAATVPAGEEPLRVFVYDSGEDVPFSAGRLGMPQSLIDAAGGRNVMDGVAGNWMQVGWEAVVEQDPQWILIVDYGERSAAQKRDFLMQHPALQGVSAIRQQHFVVLPYLAVTPSLDNAAAIETLAAALHPEAFAP